MKHASLFSGIGGFDLAAEWMGWENVFHCEWNDFGQKILKHYWPNAKSYGDITKTDFSVHRGTIDVLTGGFPCQPYSSAGKRKGKEDERHLWPDMLRAIREIQPTWVVGENVLGLVSWSDGLVFEEVQADLEAEGYEVQPYILPAASVNAPHRRDRVWFVAYSKSNFSNNAIRNERYNTPEVSKKRPNELVSSSNTTNNRLQGRCNTGVLRKEEQIGEQRFKNMGGVSGENWKNFPTQPPICDGNDGLSYRLDGITFSKWRSESIKGGGNAIVPQVAHQVFKTIELMSQNQF